MEGFVHVGKKGFIDCNVKLNYKPYIHFFFYKNKVYKNVYTYIVKKS